MIKRWAVAGIHFADNECNIQFIEAETWQAAVLQHKLFEGQSDYFEDLEEIEGMTELQIWKQRAFDGDAMFDVKEIA